MLMTYIWINKYHNENEINMNKHNSTYPVHRVILHYNIDFPFIPCVYCGDLYDGDLYGGDLYDGDSYGETLPWREHLNDEGCNHWHYQ